jgi:putative transposase
VKVRQNGRIVSVAVIIAVGVNSDGRREVLGMEIGASEAETFWTAFLRKLARHGLRGVNLVVSDSHEGIKAAVSKVLSTSWQRCRVHFMRNVLAHAGKQGRRVISAFIATAFAQDDAKAASQQWRHVADQIRPKVPRLTTLLDEAETDVLAYMTFPAAHRAKLHSTDEIDKTSSSVTWRFPWRHQRLASNPGCPIGTGARLYRSCAVADLRGGFAGGFLGPLGIQFLTI